MKVISVFIGLARNSYNKGIYSLSLYSGGEVLTLPSKFVSAQQRISENFIILTALNDFISDISENKLGELKIEFYANNNSIFDAWDKYIKSGKIDAVGADKRLWEGIIASVAKSGITLTIKGTRNNLAKLSDIENQRMRREIKKDKHNK